MNVLRTLADLIKNALILLAAIFAKQEVKYRLYIAGHPQWPTNRGRLNESIFLYIFKYTMNPIVILVSGGTKLKIDVLILMNVKKIFIHAQKQKHASIRSSHSSATQF